MATIENRNREASTRRGLTRMAAWSQLALRAGLDLVYPPRCTLCEAEFDDAASAGHSAAGLCDACTAALTSLATDYCARCGAIRAPSVASVACTACRDWPTALDGVIPLGNYEQALRDAVLLMKRGSHDPLTMAMANLYWNLRQQALFEARADLVVPMAMHWWRRLRRGTNSPELVGIALARWLAIPVETRCLRRRRNTELQRGLTPPQRIRNVRGAFRVRRGFELRGATVLLVDDVVTTGATCQEAARVLKRAGAARVVAATLARTPAHD